MSSALPPPGSDLPLLMLLGFRALIDDVHTELAEAGHAGFRPLHGVTFKAIGDGVTASELGRRLGVSKQAAGRPSKGSNARGTSSASPIPRTPAARSSASPRAAWKCSSSAFEAMAGLRARWAERLGEERMATIEEALREMTADREMRFDIPGGSAASAAVGQTIGLMPPPAEPRRVGPRRRPAERLDWDHETSPADRPGRRTLDPRRCRSWRSHPPGTRGRQGARHCPPVIRAGEAGRRLGRAARRRHGGRGQRGLRRNGDGAAEGAAVGGCCDGRAGRANRRSWLAGWSGRAQALPGVAGYPTGPT